MYLAYYDESGDDGYPTYSSPLFTLSACYLHYLHWRDAFEAIRDFRRTMQGEYGLPVKLELHTKHFVLNKRPYRALAISDSDRVSIIGLFCDLLAQLDIRIVSVVIAKPRISSRRYEVLSTALKYSVQRIENDLDPIRNPASRFLVITDDGRVGKMRRTTRKIQRINYIPSRFGPESYRQEIRSMIEDPLPKDSGESYFIQMADMVAYIVYLHAIAETGIGCNHGRLPAIVTPSVVDSWMQRLLPSLNTAASSTHPYGIVYHPT
jgi:hypothetical protein